MADRVVLHIGAMKSGTTYLQRMLDTGILEVCGGYYAGGSFKAQAKAVDSLPKWSDERPPRDWEHLAARVRHKTGTAVYSHEFLSFCPRDRVARVVASFGGAPVDVVLTVRDQAAAVPAQWQTFVRNRGADSWYDYVAILGTFREKAGKRSQRVPALSNYRRAQDVPAIIGRWQGQPGVRSVSVVLVPPAGAPPERLWQRFCEAADIDVPEPPQSDTRPNPSLGYASCELVRRLNPTLDGLSRVEHERARRSVVPALLPLRDEEDRPLLDQAGDALARRFNRRILQGVDDAGVRLVGSLEDLPVAGDPTAPASIPAPDEAEVRRAFDVAWRHCIPGVPVPPGDLDDGVAQLGRRLAARFGP